jgi:hypothetical protein
VGPDADCTSGAPPAVPSTLRLLRLLLLVEGDPKLKGNAACANDAAAARLPSLAAPDELACAAVAVKGPVVCAWAPKEVEAAAAGLWAAELAFAPNAKGCCVEVDGAGAGAVGRC